MTRIHLNGPERVLFFVEIRVRASDVNYGGHVGNDSILTLMQEARVLFYNQLGFKTETSFEGHVGQVISDAAIQYKAESFLGDVLIIEIGVSDFNKYGFDMHYCIRNKTDNRLIALGKTGIVCFDYEKRKVARIPGSLLAKLQQTD